MCIKSVILKNVRDNKKKSWLPDMSDVHDDMETEDEKKQALYCDEKQWKSESPTGGVGDDVGVPQKNLVQLM